MEVMGQCVILRCEMRYDRMQFEYSAVSPQFNVVVDCVVAPEYGAQFESVNVGTEEAPVMRAEFIGFVPDTHINGSR